MNNKFLISLLTIFLISSIFSLTPPTMFYPDSEGITVNTGTEMNWSASTGSGEIIKYNLFYSNDSGTNWYEIILNNGYVNSLNDTNTEENITFSGDGNQTIYVEIPKYANITSATINLTGLIIPPFTEIYNSYLDEDEADGETDGSADASTLGRIATAEGAPSDLYNLIYSPPNGKLWFFSLRLREEKGTENTLPSLISLCKEKLKNNPEAISKFENVLDLAGYSSVHDNEYSEFKFRVVDEKLYEVTDEFPRLIIDSLIRGIPPGVGSIEYNINLDGCDNLCIANSPNENSDILR